MDNLGEMDKFFRRYNIPRLNQEKIENINRPITGTKIEIMIKNFPTKQKPKTRQLHRLILPNVSEKLKPILFKIFQNITEEGKLPNSFYKAP